MLKHKSGTCCDSSHWWMEPTIQLENLFSAPSIPSTLCEGQSLLDSVAPTDLVQGSKDWPAWSFRGSKAQRIALPSLMCQRGNFAPFPPPTHGQPGRHWLLPMWVKGRAQGLKAGCARPPASSSLSSWITMVAAAYSRWIIISLAVLPGRDQCKVSGDPRHREEAPLWNGKLQSYRGRIFQSPIWSPLCQS